MFACFSCGTLAEAQQRPGWRGERGAKSPAVIDVGYVFIDGQYISPPYRLQVSGSEVSINETSFELSGLEDGLSNGGRRGGNPYDRGRRTQQELRDTLENDGSLVCFAGEPLQVLQGISSYELLRVLVKPESRDAFRQGERKCIPDGADEPSWSKWIGGFKCPEELRQRSESFLAKIDQVKRTNDAHLSARRMLDSSAYPLTILGMLLVVMAFGHLLSFKPDSAGGNSLEAQRAVRRSLGLLATMSALDLTWTLLVSRAGDMKELNPFGAAYIDSPVALVLLKVIATLTAVVLLFSLRRYHAAQKGAWWGCLICTLLTARWLVFHSMFV